MRPHRPSPRPTGSYIIYVGLFNILEPTRTVTTPELAPINPTPRLVIPRDHQRAIWALFAHFRKARVPSYFFFFFAFYLPPRASRSGNAKCPLASTGTAVYLSAPLPALRASARTSQNFNQDFN